MICRIRTSLDSPSKMNARSQNLSRAGGHWILLILSHAPAWFLWAISCTLTEIHMDYDNKHAYGKTRSIIHKRFINLPLVTHLVAKFMAV